MPKWFRLEHYLRTFGNSLTCLWELHCHLYFISTPQLGFATLGFLLRLPYSFALSPQSSFAFHYFDALTPSLPSTIVVSMVSSKMILGTCYSIPSGHHFIMILFVWEEKKSGHWKFFISPTMGVKMFWSQKTSY